MLYAARYMDKGSYVHSATEALAKLFEQLEDRDPKDWTPMEHVAMKLADEIVTSRTVFANAVEAIATSGEGGLTREGVAELIDPIYSYGIEIEIQKEAFIMMRDIGEMLEEESSS